ncbi:hypothetical protein N180_02790 [Pedobacter antarcticus 4BY]|uniref:Uncharacterized protein n=2 Tax=Pedobacter antarcticus TaxID=34086 RepID=A0A081PKG9_9SPHI|nr:hypothetical protein [Pedobacter antarcticus]KEQ31192.1 hypothetical protein N180_02790 [Pedobacter antarcticus 4BY]SFE54511.1 hypothetical protein SAMN03003324_00846 [Pedobacter antarcticus]
MYEKILAQLMAKNPGVSKAVLGLIATKMVAKVTEEDQIEGAITDFESNSLVSIADYASLVQKDGDKRVADALKKAKKDAGIVEPDEDPEKGKGGGQPDIAKLIADGIAAAMKPMTDMLGTTKVKETKEGLRSALKLKNIPEDWADDVHIGDDFDTEGTITRLETKWNNAKQVAINSAVGDGSVRLGNVNGATKIEDSIKEFGKTVTPKESGFNIVEV